MDGRGVDGWFASATAGSEMGALVAAHDWSSTPLGPPDTWPPPLRMAVALCLSSRFPMLVLWGPELIKVYNDGYREILGAKHPAALGAPAAEVWPEIWDRIGPMFAEVLDTGSPTWDEDQLLLIDRVGFLEETYFTWSYAPIADEDGTIGGILDICTETTAQVVGARRLATLSHLTFELAGAVDVLDVCTRAAAALGRNQADVTSADLFLDAGAGPVLTASTRRVSLDLDAVRRVAGTRRPEVVDGTYLLPMGQSSAVALGINPHRPFDDDHQSFLELVAVTIATAIADTYRRAEELGELRRISEVLQGAMLSKPPEDGAVAMRYLPAVGRLSVGGDWYDAVDLPDGRIALVVGDCVGHGLDAAARMGQLRSASRALLLDGLGPAAMLESLDRFAASVDGAECTTVFCGIVDPSGTLTYSAAGHPPALLLRWDGVEWLERGRGLPLDIGGARARDEAKVELADGDAILLYTDGLIERRGESLEAGLDRLARAAGELVGAPPGDVADGLLRALLDEAGSDDVALLVHRP